MSSFRGMFAWVVVCLAGVAAAQQSDQLAAARALGPHWKQLCRSAGTVFGGSVMSVAGQPAGKGRPIPTIEVKFRVERAVAGVQPGQLLTVREWAGAWSAHRAMLRGQHLLLFLYPPGRLGLTSPVGGSQGQIALDESGKVVAASGVSVLQLERAIRRVRKDKL